MATLEFSDTVLRMVEGYIKEHIYTAIPAKILDVSNLSSNQTIDIQPQIIETFRDDRNIELPPILDVPIIFCGGGGGLLSFPVQAGDTVLAVFSMKSIDEWMESRATDSVLMPSDKRTYNINDAIAIAGLYSKNTNLNPNSTDVELKFNGMSIRLGADNNIYIDNSSADININATGNVNLTAQGNLVASASGQVNITAPTINLNGNVNISGNLDVGGSTTITGDIEANEVTATITDNKLSTHEHPALNAPPTPGT
jgi:phage baseplate assembly protein gpV